MLLKSYRNHLRIMVFGYEYQVPLNLIMLKGYELIWHELLLMAGGVLVLLE